MIIQYEIRQVLHSVSPLIGEDRLIQGPFNTRDQAVSEAQKSSLKHLFVVEKRYASAKDLQSHLWSEIYMFNIPSGL